MRRDMEKIETDGERVMDKIFRSLGKEEHHNAKNTA